MRDWKPLGKHRICSEGDVIYWDVHGSIELGEVRQFYQLAEELLARYGWVALVVDVRDAGLPSAESRRYIAQWERRHPDRQGVVIFFGANVLLLTLGRLINNGIEMLMPRRNPRPFWVATEQEAQAILQAHHPASRAK